MGFASSRLCAPELVDSHCKQLFGVPGASWLASENPCPADKVPIMKQAFREFGLLTIDEPHA
jgi:hypothetical protein